MVGLNSNKIFERILAFDSKLNYERLFTNNKFKSEVYLISSIDFKEKYVYKIFSRGKIEYDLILDVILKLNNFNFLCPKLFYSKFDENKKKIHLIYEYIDCDEKFDISNDFHISNFILLLKNFYEITKFIDGENRNQYFLSKIERIERKLGEDNLNGRIFEFIKKDLSNLMGVKGSMGVGGGVSVSLNRVILRDINPTNILISKGKFYLIDFDEISFGELEFDLADIYLNFSSGKNVSENLLFLNKIIFGLDLKDYDIISIKIIYYLILILYHESLFIFESNSEKLSNLKKIKFFFENRVLLAEKLG
ncbi:MAG: hypothetical protein KC550_06360 [Nanoarchaeota archaeon]|nr:hypothetical protein [Nanoarchaeota archaeon]